ncbi:MAG: GH25 family lysozyme [Lachnospiraceae bacterium]|nr:GH25 family lysozyme [Lachnospiraceae bacterium]
MAGRKKKKKKRGTAALVIALAAVLAVCAILTLFVLAKKRIISVNEWLVNRETRTIGVDISAYQADVDMEKLKVQGIDFIFIKATEGTTHQDRRFAENWENAKNAGLPAGAYHFFSYRSPGETQAENFIETVGPDLSGRLLPVVDVEFYGEKAADLPAREDVVRELAVFLDALEACYGVKPMIYAPRDIWARYIDGAFDGYKIWMSSVNVPIGFAYSGRWDVWQYFNRAVLEGYSGGEKYIDMNVLNRKTTLEDLLVP